MMRRRALAWLASMFESGSKEVKWESIEKFWLNAQENEKTGKEKAVPEYMETQPPVGDADNLEEIIE